MFCGNFFCLKLCQPRKPQGFRLQTTHLLQAVVWNKPDCEYCEYCEYCGWLVMQPRRTNTLRTYPYLSVPVRTSGAPCGQHAAAGITTVVCPASRASSVCQHLRLCTRRCKKSPHCFAGFYRISANYFFCCLLHESFSVTVRLNTGMASVVSGSTAK